jgi:phospholipase/carboxylesterase
MSVQNNTSLVEFNNWTLRIKESSNASPRPLLLLHGLTGDENSMWIFTRDMPSDYWMIAPRAPHKAEPFGYSWRALRPGTFGRPSLEQLLDSAEALIRLMDEYQASAKIEASVFDVIGFSQGAAMSSVLALLYPDRIGKVGILAGFVPSGLDEYIARRPLEGKNIFVAHGTKDDMVPVERARASMELLERAGAKITYCEDEVGHKVSLACIRALRHYLLE